MLRINKEMKAIGHCPVYSPDVRVLRHRVQNDRIFRQLCVTVCMQDKFEPTSIGKNPWILLSECPNKVRPCVQGISGFFTTQKKKKKKESLKKETNAAITSENW